VKTEPDVIEPVENTEIKSKVSKLYTNVRTLHIIVIIIILIIIQHFYSAYRVHRCVKRF